MSADKLPEECGSARASSGNADYRWAQFDSEAYFQHYYGEPHADDDLVIRHAVEAMKHASPIGAELDVVDVGTGPNLIPLFCALPRARSLTVWEYAQSNVTWLEAEMERADMRPQWQHFWSVTREAYRPVCRLPDNPTSAIRAKTVIRQGSIFDLPEREWDAATMFFCAEFDHRPARRVRSRVCRLFPLRKVRRRFDRRLSRALGRICRGRSPFSLSQSFRRND